MVPDFPRLVRGATLLLMALPAAAVEVAAAETRPVLHSLGRAVVWVALAAGLSWLSPVSKLSRKSPPLGLSLIPTGLLLGAFLLEPFQRRWTGDGHPLELQMISDYGTPASGWQRWRPGRSSGAWPPS